MKTNQKQLPLELVEQMYESISDVNFKWAQENDFIDDEYLLSTEQCAKIAVDYAEEEKRLIKQERDELIEMLHVVTLTPMFENIKQTYGHSEKHWTNKLKQLLKKHEDGE